MNHDADRSGRLASGSRHRRSGVPLLVLVAAVGAAALAGLPRPEGARSVAPADVERAPARQAAAPLGDARWLDPTPALGSQAFRLGQDVPLGPAFRLASAPPPSIAALAPPEPPAPPADEDARTPPSAPETARLAPSVPVPTPRPRDLLPPPEPRLADRGISTRAKAVPGAPPEDNRSLFQKLFGLSPSPGRALAYAPMDGRPGELAPGRRPSPTPVPPTGGGTAVYDITARTVTLPNGETLEAHSGLGETMDDPRAVHLRMRGATPPGTYDLTEREQPFHGVRALRLHPVGGSRAIYGRAGLLAHSYLLGPSGASNGCVSFKNYDRFLQAYLKGEVQRLVVVSGRGQDGPPAIGSSRIGLFGRSAPRAGDG